MKIPYRAIGKGKEKPLISVVIRNPSSGQLRRFLGLVDSGSDSCFFDAEIGESIGLTIKDGSKGELTGVVPGKRVIHYAHEVYLEVQGKSYFVKVGFVYGLYRHGYGILGQNGFFDSVTSVIFEKQKGVFEVID